jgi:hypothetical protein
VVDISMEVMWGYNRCPHWSVRMCIKIFLSYSVYCWKHEFYKAFRYLNISMYFCMPLSGTPCIYRIFLTYGRDNHTGR